MERSFKRTSAPWAQSPCFAALSPSLIASASLTYLPFSLAVKTRAFLVINMCLGIDPHEAVSAPWRRGGADVSRGFGFRGTDGRGSRWGRRRADRTLRFEEVSERLFAGDGDGVTVGETAAVVFPLRACFAAGEGDAAVAAAGEGEVAAAAVFFVLRVRFSAGEGDAAVASAGEALLVAAAPRLWLHQLSCENDVLPVTATPWVKAIERSPCRYLQGQWLRRKRGVWYA